MSNVKYLIEEEDLKYKLGCLNGFDPGDIYDDYFDVGYKLECGIESFASTSITELAGDALERIEKLEGAIVQTIGWIEEVNALKEGDGGESLRLLREVVDYDQCQ